MKRKIGVLALQGDFHLHVLRLQEIGVEASLVKKPAHLEECDGLIMPGGESTTLIKLLGNIGLSKAIPDFARNRPIFGTCAGAILLSKEVVNHPVQSMGLIDISIERNAYGTQIDSFSDTIELRLPGLPKTVEGVFIRAPRITRIGGGVKAVAFHGEEVVMAQSGNILAATFHPEVAQTIAIHQYFAEAMCK